MDLNFSYPAFLDINQKYTVSHNFRLTSTPSALIFNELYSGSILLNKLFTVCALSCEFENVTNLLV